MFKRIFGLTIVVALAALTYVGCTKSIKEVAGPTEVDTLTVKDTVQTWQAAVTVIHEFYGDNLPDDIVEFMTFTSIPIAFPNESYQWGSKSLGLNKFEITGVVYIWSIEAYSAHIDTAEYKDGAWLVDDYPTTGKIVAETSLNSNKLKKLEFNR